LTEAERLQIEEEVARAAKDSVVLWKGRADRGEWDEVKADLEVYRLSGETVKEDPRRTPEYRQRVIDGLGFGENWKDKRPNFSAQDLAACREVLSRKAAGFWLEDSPRTTLRFVKHDTIPTGPPVCTPPHNLGQEAAQWTDEKLESEVARGQLVRGDSPWGSPPFPVGGNEPAHKKKRKRRLVVDYRRVNARVARSVYYCKRLSDVLGEVAGSVYMTFVDACTGFNQVLNTERAKRVLAVVSRTGKFLPVGLTFGPTNGPDDFAYVVDRVYAPGRGRRLRLGREWLAYVDDLTIRSGRCIDGVLYRDSERDEEVREAFQNRKAEPPQHPAVALEAMGFNPAGLGEECDARKSRKPRLEAPPQVPIERAVWAEETLALIHSSVHFYQTNVAGARPRAVPRRARRCCVCSCFLFFLIFSVCMMRDI
jgi:hypothetical protein